MNNDNKTNANAKSDAAPSPSQQSSKPAHAASPVTAGNNKGNVSMAKGENAQTNAKTDANQSASSLNKGGATTDRSSVEAAKAPQASSNTEAKPSTAKAS